MITPFSDEQSAATIADLAIENGKDRVVLSGTLEIRRDMSGLRRAEELKKLAVAIVQALSGADLPDELEAADDARETSVANPFQ